MLSGPLSMISRICLCGTLVLAAASSAVGSPDDVKVITVEGRAAGTDANAEEQAKQDALRKAVERACGTFISAQTKTKDYAAVYDKAMSFAAGYITEFEVLERRTEGGLSICKVRAKVSTASFEKEWARLLHTIAVEGNPRCVVVVVEDTDADDLTPPKTNGVVQSVLEKFFLEKGVQLMDKEATSQVRERDVTLAALNDDVGKLAAMAASFKADVLIKGVAEAREAGTVQVSGRTLYKWSGTISIRAYHTDSAQLLMSNSYSATKSTVNANAGGDQVLRKCAEENSGRILRAIGEAWRQRQNIRRVCQVTLENCSRKDYKVFEAGLREVGGVQSVRLKELVNKICQVEVDWSYDLERLISRIEQMKVPDTTYEVTEQTHDRVTLKLVK